MKTEIAPATWGTDEEKEDLHPWCILLHLYSGVTGSLSLQLRPLSSRFHLYLLLLKSFGAFGEMISQL